MGGAAIRTGVSGTLSAASGSEDRIILNNGHGVSRPDISSWLMKAWGSGVEYLTPSDQIWTATSIASVYGLLGYKRKHAFFLRQISMLVLATMKTSSFTRRLSGIPSLNGSMENLCGLPESSPVGEMAVAAAGFTLITDGVAFPETDAGPTTSNTITTQFKQSTGGKTRRRKTNGALECMKRVCDVLGIGSKGDLCKC